MKPGLAAGLGLTVLGTAGYAAGILSPYPGRSFSLTVLMLGVALAVVGRTEVDQET